MSLVVDSISVKYFQHILISNASMTIKAGSITGLLGPNGSGKTTFFDVLCGLKKIESGRIYDGFKKKIYLSQIISTPPVLRMFDVFNMAMLFCSEKKMTQQHALEKIEQWSPGIAQRYAQIWRKKSALCSYGEKRWFFTLSLLAVGADCVLFDEPTAGVDPEFRFHIWRCLRGAAKEGVAILVSSHNVEEVVTQCDDFYMLAQHRFNHFASGDDFMKTYNAHSLDEAFIKAASLSRGAVCAS
ncbi:ATP-binding cassette domain-containing protein [Pseudomonas sp. SDO528_S397]